ncbi:MAG TPA: M56 family metallopeptidase [Dissulfurispiraceae bacterium]|nr:M56 family metallopeptidase [Dissulfurispiraceae bacterium]
MATFLNTYWGMYVAQSVVHSVVAATIAEGAIFAWKIRAPHVKQWFRFAVIFLSLVSYPAYQLVSPDRGNIYFRISSLMDTNRWFLIERWGILPFLALFAVVLVISAVVFMIQELAPILSSIFVQMRRSDQTTDGAAAPELKSRVSEAIKGLPIDEGIVEIFDDDDMLLYSSTGLKPMIHVSTGLIKAFNPGHLQVAIAHEIAHIQRSRRPMLIFAYLLRVLLFFNPVAAIEFRRLAHEEEKVCDDIAVELTGRPAVLSEAIEMLRPGPEDYRDAEGRTGAERLVSTIEYYGHDALLKSRAARIALDRQKDRLWGVAVTVAAVLMIGINYFVV